MEMFRLWTIMGYKGVFIAILSMNAARLNAFTLKIYSYILELYLILKLNFELTLRGPWHPGMSNSPNVTLALMSKVYPAPKNVM